MNRLISSWFWYLNNPGVIRAYKEIKAHEGHFGVLVSDYFERILSHAIKTVPFYQNCSFVGVEKINQLPIMTKEIIRSQPKELVSSKIGIFKYWENTSGGSTGEPVRLIQDEEYQRWVGASLHYYFKDLLGCEWSSSRKMDIWGSVEDLEKKTMSLKARLRNRLSNTLFVNAFKFGQEEMRDTVNKINRHRPQILKGYANSLYDLACFVEGNGLMVNPCQVISTRTAMVYPEQRKTMERVFGGRVYDFYGSRESSSIAGEIPNTDGLMILAFNNIVEVLDGEILITNLHNYSMPLIRYKIMDQADSVIINSCGLPVLHGLNGRVFDYFQIDEHRRLHVQYVITLFFFIDELVSFQVVQHDFTHFTINYVPHPRRDIPESKRKEIVAKMRNALRDDIRIDWKVRSEIEKTPSGKHFYAKCEI